MLLEFTGYEGIKSSETSQMTFKNQIYGSIESMMIELGVRRQEILSKEIHLQ